MLRLCVLIVALMTTAASADDIDQAAITEKLRACYNAADTAEGKLACIFTVSESCQAEEEGGYSTLGMSMCNHAESQAWDVLLNEEYKAAQTFGAEMDEDEATHFPNLDKRTDTLRAAQRAWIQFRDAECINEYAQWGSGSMRHIAGTACTLEMTAERTIDLWGKYSMFQ